MHPNSRLNRTAATRQPPLLDFAGEHAVQYGQFGKAAWQLRSALVPRPLALPAECQRRRQGGEQLMVSPRADYYARR